jgi:hypothetical protein
LSISKSAIITPKAAIIIAAHSEITKE